MKTINIKSKLKEYKVYIDNHLLDNLNDFLDTDRFYVIVSDNQIPVQYIKKVQSALPKNLVITFPAGENSKSLSQFESIILTLQKNNIKRDACIVALGGGVTGDLAGYVASVYLRGIDYIQIPTTLLAQIDSSVGGKVAINTVNAKNSIGSIYPPSLVIIDPSTLDTLDSRQFNNGMAEMIKYGMIHSKVLFDEILFSDIKSNITHFIYESVLIKKYYIENDEFDTGIRQKLNFGHTYGHAYEALYNYEKYLHGESVALGMLKVSNFDGVKGPLIKVLTKYNLPIKDDATDKDLISYIINDKKSTRDSINLITVNEIGKAEIVKKNIQEVLI